jgi:hypothetical protein
LTYDEAKDWIFENIPDYVPPKPTVGDFSKFVLPVIGNMMPRMTVEELVSVQPMHLPTATIFYLDFIRRPPLWKRVWQKFYAWVAQLVEHATENRGVVGAIPTPGTIFTFLSAK